MFKSFGGLELRKVAELPFSLVEHTYIYIPPPLSLYIYLNSYYYYSTYYHIYKKLSNHITLVPVLVGT